MKFKPLGKKIIVEKANSKKSSSLIILLEDKEGSAYEVKEVGPDCQYLKPGDTILIDRHALETLKIPGIGDITKTTEGWEYGFIRLDRASLLQE